MRRDDWTEETVPSQRAERGRAETGAGVGSSRGRVPFYAWVVAAVAVLSLLVVCSLWGLYLFRGWIPAQDGPTPAPIILTALPVPSPVATSTPPPTETAEPVPTQSPGIAIGRYVQVTGTEGYGLSLRAGPGESYTRMDVALEGEVFIVVEGPVQVGDFAWWKVRAPDDSEREWWAVGNFLEPVEHP